MRRRAFELLLLAVFAASVWYGRGWIASLLPAPTPGKLTARTDAATARAAPAAALAPTGAVLAAAPPVGFSKSEAETMRTVFALFAVGDFVNALKFADEAMVHTGISDGFHAWLLEQLPVLLTSAGWAKLKLGDCDTATTYLRRSEAMKRVAETAKGLAVCYYKQKNLAAARDQFTAYFEKQPGDFQMLLLYTDLLESDGRFEEAVRILEQLVVAPAPAADEPPRPDLEALKQRLESMRGRARQSTLQQTESSPNFRLTYQAGDHEDLVPYVLTTLEDALEEYEGSFGFHAPPAPIEVILYPADDFRSIVVGGPEWAEGLFDGRLRIPVRAETEPGSLTVVLRHELVHALLSLMSDSRTIPPWFDEGMAQRLSCAGQPCGTFAFEPRPGGFLAPQAFMTSYISLSAVNAGRAYRQSLFLIMVLERRYGGDVLRKLVGHITTSSDMASDGLLQPLGITFKYLHEVASQLWTARQVPTQTSGR